MQWRARKSGKRPRPRPLLTSPNMERRNCSFANATLQASGEKVAYRNSERASDDENLHVGNRPDSRFNFGKRSSGKFVTEARTFDGKALLRQLLCRAKSSDSRPDSVARSLLHRRAET